MNQEGASTALVRRCRSGDIEEHTRQLQDWRLEYDQLDRGRFEGGFDDIRLPGLQLFRESTTRGVRQRGALMSRSIGLAMPLAGEGEMSFAGLRVPHGALMVCAGDDIDLLTPPGCTLAGVVVDVEALHAWLAPMPVDADRLLSTGLRVSPPSVAVARWRDTLCATLQALATQPARLMDDAAARTRLQADLMGAVVEVLTATPAEEAPLGDAARKRLVDRACDILLAESDDPPSLAQLCQRLGTSPRKLSYCFQELIGMSPARYIKALRLNAVRRALSRAHAGTDSVYDLATRWGFWHFGHFSTDYKRQFAELPSETLRRARAR